MHSHFGDEVCGGKPGARAEEVAERGASHLALGRQDLNSQRATRIGKHASSELFQQPLPFRARRGLNVPLEGEREFEQCYRLLVQEEVL